MRYACSVAALLVSLTIARPAAATILNFVVALDPGYARSGPVPAATVTFTLDTSTAVPDLRPFYTGYLDLDPVLVTVVSAGAPAISYSALPVLELAEAGGAGDLALISPTNGGYRFFSNDQNHRYLVTSGANGISFLEGTVPIFTIQYLVENGIATISEVTAPPTTVPEPASVMVLGWGLAGVLGLRARRARR